MREVITLWHRLMSINVELVAIVLRRPRQNVQIRGGVGLRREPQPHRRPTVLVFNQIESLFIQVVVDVNPFGMTGVRHAVIAHKNDINNIGEIAGLQGIMKVLGEQVNRLQRILSCL